MISTSGGTFNATTLSCSGGSYGDTSKHCFDAGAETELYKLRAQFSNIFRQVEIDLQSILRNDSVPSSSKEHGGGWPTYMHHDYEVNPRFGAH